MKNTKALIRDTHAKFNILALFRVHQWSWLCIHRISYVVYVSV